MSTAFRIQRPASAFALSSGKKRPREKDKNHLEFVAGLPSIVSGQYGVHACHIRFGSIIHGKRGVGGGEKPDDKWTVPLTPDEHLYGADSQHGMNEQDFWAAKKINPIIIAALLWAATGDHEAGVLICQNARQICGGHA